MTHHPQDLASLKGAAKTIIRDAKHKLALLLGEGSEPIVLYIVGGVWPDSASAARDVLSEVTAMQNEGERNHDKS